MRYFLLIISLSISSLSFAQKSFEPLTPEQENKIYESLSKLTKAEWKEKYHKEYPRVPNYKRQNFSVISNSEENPENKLKRKSANAFRNDSRFPSEFEELQGVFISWPYNSGVIDIVPSSPYAIIYGKLADAIQKNAKAYINVDKAADTVKVKNYMSTNGTPLINYQFMVNPTDAFWVRDYGPINYYYGAQDSIGWIDFKYYTGRELDNLLPQKWGAALNIPVRTTPIGYEGGNILHDGRGHLLTSSMVLEANLLDYGFSAQTVKDSLDYIFNLKSKDIIKYLPHDGGTGHIDLYIDMMDENSYVTARFPDQMKSITAFPDYGFAASNIDTLKSRLTLENKAYRFRDLTLPPKDDGSWYTSGTDYNKYTRTYANHLIVNKAIIQPIFHNDIDGYKPADDTIMDLLKHHYPGYTIYPIDMRDFDGSGGSVHCITKEFHAPNPLTIWHYSYDGEYPYQGTYPMTATIHNNSGIASAFIYYRKKGTTTWTKSTLTKTTGENFAGQINSNNPKGDSIEYYIEATSVNGKTINKPMTAPAGFYNFSYKQNLSSIESPQSLGLGSFYPNPIIDKTSIDINFVEQQNIKISISSIDGKLIKEVNYKNVIGDNTIQINTEDFPKGFYNAVIYLNNKQVSCTKLVK